MIGGCCSRINLSWASKRSSRIICLGFFSMKNHKKSTIILHSPGYGWLVFLQLRKTIQLVPEKPGPKIRQKFSRRRFRSRNAMPRWPRGKIHQLVGGLVAINFIFPEIYRESLIIIPTDEQTYFSEGWPKHQPASARFIPISQRWFSAIFPWVTSGDATHRIGVGRLADFSLHSKNIQKIRPVS